MNLKKIERTAIKQGVASIRVANAGAINFSAEFCRTIGVNPTFKVGFYQDQDRPVDWYVNFSKGEENDLRPGGGKDSLILNNSTIAKGILKSMNILSSSGIFKMSTNPMEHSGMKLYAIITKSSK